MFKIRTNIKNRLLMVLIIPIGLFSCGGGSGGEADVPQTPTPIANPPISTISKQQAASFLLRATFGPTESEIAKVQNLGYEGWIDQQLATPQTYTRPFYDQALIERGDLGLAQKITSRMDSWWHAAINGDDQLRQRVAYALSQIFVISDREGGVGNPRSVAHYHDLLAENAFANYSDLLKEVTLSFPMGVYLNMMGNMKARPDLGIKPDENFAREIMQLFSIGLVELNTDGSPVLVNGKEVETYNQEIVRNFARVFTGWNVDGGRYRQGDEILPMTRWGENQTFHDFDSKVLLNGEVIPAGLSTEEDLDAALNNIFQHKNVGPFVAIRLIQRLVTSNPTPAYVERVATKFNDNGSGVRGDMEAVIKAILLDTEALNSAINLNGGKLKEPILKVSQVWRAFNAKSSIDYIRFALTTRIFGQKPYGSDSVFNFYTPFDAPLGAISDQDLIAPEFLIMDDTTITRSLLKLHQIATSAVVGSGPNDFSKEMILDLAEAKTLANDVTALIDFLDERLLFGHMSPILREVLTDDLNQLPANGTDDENRQLKVAEAISIILVSPDYSVQR